MSVDNPIPDEYRVDHLILLVGGNPLPNAVAGLLLHRPGGRITLLHTNQTEGIAGRLGSWLQKQTGIMPQPVSIDEVHRDEIHSKVKAVVNNTGSVGLHYTGGTKAMAVHAYTKARELRPGATFSYLDARRLALIFEKDRLVVPVNQAVGTKIQFADLLNFHGWEMRSSQQLEPNPKQKPRDAPADYQGNGKKFERDVYQQLLSVAPEVRLHDVRTNTFAQQGPVTAEFDVTAMCGYQLFLLSCTIADPHPAADSVELIDGKRKILKQKLFEAHLRARQLGGDEARAALVCYANDPTLVKEVASVLQTEDQTRVFMRHQLPNLAYHLKRWISSQNQPPIGAS